MTERKEYKSYSEWKRWDSTFQCSSIEGYYFDGETQGCRINNAKILEIGFGAGSFLAWAKSKGALLYGTEINQEMQSAAVDFGVQLLPTNISEVADEYKEFFDTIVAFDVFEHLDLNEIDKAIKAIKAMLKKDGKLLIRVPNTQSPFGLVYQNGDPTHKTSLSCSIFKYISIAHQLKIERCGDQYSVKFYKFGLRSGAITLMRYIVRKMISYIFSFAHNQNISWDANVVVVMKKHS